jgi:hemerythrin-like domain-containing protein
MTEHLTMNTIIHAAFRRDMKRFDDALSVFTPGDQARASDLGRAWDNFAYQLHHHHDDEETIFWPAFAKVGVDPKLVEELEGEHDRMSAALVGAEGAMKAFTADPSPAGLDTARGAIAELQVVLDEHLKHEERDLEPWSATQMKKPELKAAQGAVRKAHKGGAGTFAAWLQDGASSDDIAALKHEIPGPVLAVMTRFPGRRYRKNIAPIWK